MTFLFFEDASEEKLRRAVNALSTLDNDTSLKHKITCNNAKYKKSYHETRLIRTGSGSRLTYKRDERMPEREILSSIKYVHTNEINENINIA